MPVCREGSGLAMLMPMRVLALPCPKPMKMEAWGLDGITGTPICGISNSHHRSCTVSRATGKMVPSSSPHRLQDLVLEILGIVAIAAIITVLLIVITIKSASNNKFCTTCFWMWHKKFLMSRCKSRTSLPTIRLCSCVMD